MAMTAVAGWVSITMLIRHWSRAAYYYRFRSAQALWHICLALITPFVFLGVIILALALLYVFKVITTGQF